MEAGGTSHALRQVARYRHTHEEPNVLWARLQHILEAISPPATIPTSADVRREQNSAYTAERVDKQPDSLVRALREALPEDIALNSALVLGYVECDTLNWLFNNQESKFLTLVAPRGSGKSSLMAYLFGTVWAQAPSMQRFCPLILDLLRVGRAPSRFEVFGQLVSVADVLFTQLRHLGMTDLFDPLQLKDIFLGPNDIIPAHHNPVLSGLMLNRFIQRILDRLAPQNRELVIVFDNSDQLVPQAVATVLELARDLAIGHGIRVIVPMRPFNERTRFEKPSELGAFPHVTIDVPPASLTAILHEQLVTAKRNNRIPRGSVTLDVRRHLPVQLKSHEVVLRQFLDFFVDNSVQDFILRNLCNYNVRRALLAVRHFMQYHDLPVGAFVTAASLAKCQSAGLHMRNRLESFDLLNGLMLGPYRSYIERSSNPVKNIFNLANGQFPDSYTLQYRLLELLVWKNDTVEFAWCQLALERLGYSSVAIRAAAEKLLSSGLITSPEHDESIVSVVHLRVGPSGEFYYHELVRNSDYVFNIVADTPLAHEAWQREDAMVTQHYGSLVELFSRVAAIEARELTAMQVPALSWMIAPVRRWGLLSDKLASAIGQELRIASRSSKQVVREHGNFLSRSLEHDIRPKVRSLQELLVASSVQAWGEPEHRQQLCDISLAEGGRLAIIGPTCIRAGATAPLEIQAFVPTALQETSMCVFLELRGASQRLGESCLVALDGGTLERRGTIVLEGSCNSGSPVRGDVLVTARGRLIGTGTLGV